MLKGNIGLIDSGIGGLSVLKELVLSLPNENFVYLGDNGNAPYGIKTDRELIKLAVRCVEEIKKHNISVLVVACNTLSLRVADTIRDFSPVPVFFVYPPQEFCSIHYKKTLLLATPASVNALTKYKNIEYFATSKLVQEIESLAIRKQKIVLEDFLPFNAGDFECVILGCTHFSLIKNEILDHLKPLDVVCGEFFTSQKVKKFVLSQKLLVKNKRNQVLFIGENAQINEKFWLQVVKPSILYDNFTQKKSKKWLKGVDGG